MGYSFKNHSISEADRLWLQEVYKSKEFNPRIAKVNSVPEGRRIPALSSLKRLQAYHSPAGRGFRPPYPSGAGHQIQGKQIRDCEQRS